MSNEQNNNRSIFKATAILGSVQVFNIIIGIVRNKIVSILLGPSGMGIVGLLQSTSSTVSGLTNCGVSQSVVKNVAMAYEEKNYTLLGKIVYTLKRLVVTTGLLGSLFMLLFCRQLSVWTFGNEDFTISFACLSISILFTQLANSFTTIVKGCRQIKYYAKANVLGHFCSLLISVPLYYVWGKDAIAPVLVLVSISTFLFAYIYKRKLRIEDVKASKEEFKAISWDILKMGLPLAASDILPIFASYLIRIHVSTSGSIADVGLYSAAFAILNGYVGMIFTAMSSDYIPRLSAISSNNETCTQVINSQIRLSILILFPILLSLIGLVKLVVLILYSSKFYPMCGIICWGALGMLYKTFNWCYGCLLIPKRESRVYFILSVLSVAVFLGASIGLYDLLGLTGLGIAFLVSHSFDFLAVYVFIKRKYQIGIYKRIFGELFAFTLLILLLVYLNVYTSLGLWQYVLEGMVIVAAYAYSLICLDRLVGIKEFVRTKFKR